MIRGSWSTVLVLASVLLASPALADPDPNEPSDKDKQVASALVKKAIARGQAGDHSAAIEIYLQAYTIVPNPALLSNIGAQFQESGKPQEALRYFCMYLDKDPSGTNAPYAASQAKKLRALLGDKDVDDDDVCVTPKPKPKPRPEPKQKEPRESKEPREPKQPKEPKQPAAPLDEPEGHGDGTLRVLGIGSAGLGVVVLGISAYAGYKGKTISDEINSHPMDKPWPDNIKTLQKSGENYNTLAITTVIGGGALVATGAILYIVSRPSGGTEPAHDKAVVHVTPTINGFAVFGTF